MINSKIFGHQWTTNESREIFSEPARVARWLDIIIVLAEAQAECGIISAGAATEIAKLRNIDLPIDDIAERTRETSHSTLGMIQVLRDLLPASAAEYVYYGTTVQDITDTSQVLEMRQVGALLWRDLWRLESELLQLADQHRATPMAGRTHGQPGSPISFGFKAASWADEIGRHLQRLSEARRRLLVGQFGGAVGTLAFFADRAPALRTAFCRRLEIDEPAISWLSARDRLAEFAHIVAMATSTLARIANEVYNLQRLEIGELAERTKSTTVGSITMPHKRNPENSEQIVTLAHLIRTQSAVLTDTMVHEHERDGKSWKTEWSAFPELCHFALACTSMATELVLGLEVNADAMAGNLGAGASSEHVLSLLSARLGKHNAQALLQDAYRKARSQQLPVQEVLKDVATDEELVALATIKIGMADVMIDQVLESVKHRRSQESDQWL